jgi:tRNA(Ile)-lysidine synthase
MHLFTPDNLKNQLSAWPRPGCYWIAFSGGLDSTALLHAMTQIGTENGAGIRVIHINHGLHEQADSWQQHCQNLCEQMGLPFTCETVVVGQSSRQSPEAEARAARYSAIVANMQKDDMLLTAHHADDQAETLILNLMRGAGVDGLAAIRPLRRRGEVWLGRPLLSWRREQLRRYLADLDIDYIEDPSNDDQAIRRNYVRHEILPRLTRMWPAATDQLNKTAKLVRSASSVLQSVGESDLARCRGEKTYEIDLDLFGQFNDDRQALIVREWARSNHLPSPDQRQVQELLRQMQQTGVDSALCLQWPGVEVHRYRSKLYIMAALPESPQDWQLEWNGREPVELPGGSGRILLRGSAAGLFAEEPLQLHSRSGSELIQPAGEAHHKSLKQLFQSAGVPPWLRSRIPLLSQNGQCLAVGDIWLDQGFVEQLSGLESSLLWEPGLQQWRDTRKDMLAIE